MITEIPAWLVDSGPPFHPWERAGARSTRCVQCGLRAVEACDTPPGKPYIVWRWRNLMWDSRTSTVPTCPPSYKRDNGINPTVVIPA